MSEDFKNVVLAIDIGSSRTHLATVDLTTLSCLKKNTLDNGNIETRLSSVLQDHKTSFSVHKVNISSCVRAFASLTAEICRESEIKNITEIRAKDDLPVSFFYDKVETLGSDRVADCIACSRLFGKKNCIIIDSGTAITIDYLYKGTQFEGGAILAGIGLQLKALHLNTDVLPHLDTNESFTPVLPGRSTVEGIGSGVLYATAGAISRCVQVYKEKYGPDVVTVATGGGWPVTKDLIDFEYRHIPDLTLIGTACF
ncbi:MAG: type III pantothenate kinase [Chitinispirillaceae bacterium]